MSSFDKLLQGLAQVNGYELEIYHPNYYEIEQDRRKRKFREEEELLVMKPGRSKFRKDFIDDSSNDIDPDLIGRELNFDNYLKKYHLTACEADYKLAKMNRKDFLKILREQLKEEKVQLMEDLRNLDSKDETDKLEEDIRNHECPEDIINLNIKNKCAFFHFESLYRIFETNLRKEAENDSILKEKLQEMEPVITAKSLVSLYDSIRDHLRNVVEMSSDIIWEMQSIYKRARKPYKMLDVRLDLKRIRKMKAASPNLSLQGLLQAFTHRKEHESIECSEVVVAEALKRLGAIHYGPSEGFAKIINETDLDFMDEEIIEGARSAPVTVRMLNKIQRAITEVMKKKGLTASTSSGNLGDDEDEKDSESINNDSCSHELHDGSNNNDYGSDEIDDESLNNDSDND